MKNKQWKWYWKYGILISGSLLILYLVLSVINMVNNTPDETTLISTRLTLGYIPNIQFAPVYVAIEKGYFEDAGFEVTLEYGSETDAVALVGSGNQTFAVASGEQVLLARAQGLPVVYVAAWYQNYPVGVVSFSEAQTESPQDLKDMTIGIPGLYGASYIGFKALLNAGDLTENDVNLLSIGFNQVEAMVSEQVDASVVYLANEPVMLRSQGYDVNVIRVSDYMQLVSNGLVTNETTRREHPEQVSGCIKALLKGISDTIENPDEAYEISKKYVENLAEADETVQREVLDESIDLWKTQRPGFSEPTGWMNMQQVLLDMGLLEEALDLNEAFTNDLLP
ncbi:MAG: ABC transporter substrate-binding protein [Chloroflexota bacterium]|nr:ABC transporter substrate-binding protein [Chloroflexota bacterium]